jgi:hypothetical protein
MHMWIYGPVVFGGFGPRGFLGLRAPGVFRGPLRPFLGRTPKGKKRKPGGGESSLPRQRVACDCEKLIVYSGVIGRYDVSEKDTVVVVSSARGNGERVVC